MVASAKGSEIGDGAGTGETGTGSLMVVSREESFFFGVRGIFWAALCFFLPLDLVFGVFR